MQSLERMAFEFETECDTQGLVLGNLETVDRTAQCCCPFCSSIFQRLAICKRNLFPNCILESVASHYTHQLLAWPCIRGKQLGWTDVTWLGAARI